MKRNTFIGGVCVVLLVLAGVLAGCNSYVNPLAGHTYVSTEPGDFEWVKFHADMTLSVYYHAYHIAVEGVTYTISKDGLIEGYQKRIDEPIYIGEYHGSFILFKERNAESYQRFELEH